MAIVVTKPEIAFSPIRTQINEYMYCIKRDAQRSREVEQIMMERDIEVREAYRFSYGVAMTDEMVERTPTSTEFVAANIIALKERYAKRIRRCKLRHRRFERLVQEVRETSENDADTLIKAFCTTIEVDERDVKAILRMHIPLLKNLYGIE